MKLQRKSLRTVAVAATASMAFILTGCLGASSSTDGDDITLEYWDHSGNADEQEMIRQILTDFEDSHPGISVDFLSLPADSALQKLNTAISSGSTPDVSSISGSMLSPFVAQDALEPLDERLADSELAAGLDEGSIEAVKADAGGSLFSLPFTIGSAALWYRSDWFEDAGLNGIQTWDDFYSAADHFTDSEDGTYGFTLRGGSGGVFPLLQYMYAYSGVDELFTDDGVSTIDDQANIDAVERYIALYKTATPEADLNNGFAQMVEQFDSGQVAMLQHNLGSLANHEAALPDKFEAAMFPPSVDGPNVVLSDPIQQYVMYSSTDHPDEAWELIEYLMSAGVNSTVNELKGQLPVNLDARDEPWVGSLQALSAARDLLASPDTVVFAPPLYLPEYSDVIRNDMEPMLQQLLSGEISANDFLGHLADALTVAQSAYDERAGGN